MERAAAMSLGERSGNAVHFESVGEEHTQYPNMLTPVPRDSKSADTSTPSSAGGASAVPSATK